MDHSECFADQEVSANRVYNYATNSTVTPPDATVVGLLSGHTFYFKPFIAGTGVQVDEVTNPGAITISYTGVPGPPYTYSTLPDPSTDASVVATMSGNNFQFRGLASGTNMDILQSTNVVTFNGPTLAASPSPGSTPLVDPQVGNEFRIKGLLPGNNVTLGNVSGGVTISAASYTYSSAAYPGAIPIIGSQAGTNFGFRALLAGQGIILDDVSIPGVVVISAVADTFSTIPSAQAQVTVVGTKVGNDFQFKGFRGGTNITVEDVSAANVITISGPTYSSNIIANTFPITAPQSGQDFRFKPLNAGTNMSIDTTTLSGALTFHGPTLAPSPGAAQTLVDPQSGNEFRIKRLGQGANIFLDAVSTPGTITIHGPTYSSNVVANSFPITDSQVVRDFRFKPLKQGDSIVIDAVSSLGALIINGPTLASTGVGTTSLVAPIVGNEFRIKTLTAGPNITLDSSVAGNVTITGPAPSVYTYSTSIVPGSDATLLSGQVGNNFVFKPFNNGVNITIEDATLPGALTINGPTYSSLNVPGTFPITAPQSGQDFRFFPLNAGTSIVLDMATALGAITINGPTLATNPVPSTVSLVDAPAGNELRVKPLFQGSSIILDTVSLPGAVTINGPTLASNVVASSVSLVDAPSGNQFRIKPLFAGTNMTLDTVANLGAVTINGPTLVSTASAGQSLVDAQFGSQFRIKRIAPGPNITLDSVTTPGSVIITGPSPNVYTYSTDPIVGYDATVVSTQVANDFRFKPFKAGAGITIDEVSLPGAITITSLAQNVKINQSIFVDALFGSDATGTRLEFSLPFETITAALAVALPGDTVVVRPGIYVETLTLLNGVNLVFNSGANLVTPLIDSLIITGNVTANIYSMGNITGRINILSHTGDIFIQTHTLTANALSAISISGSTTNLDIVTSSILVTNANLINIGTSPTTSTKIATNLIVSSGVSLISAADFGNLEIETVELQATTTTQNIITATTSTPSVDAKLRLAAVNATLTTTTGSIFNIADNTVTPSLMNIGIIAENLTTTGIVLAMTSSKAITATPNTVYPTLTITSRKIIHTHTIGNTGSFTTLYGIVRSNVTLNYGNLRYDINTATLNQMFNANNSEFILNADEMFSTGTQTITNMFINTAGSLLAKFGYATFNAGFISSGQTTFQANTLNMNVTAASTVTSGQTNIIAEVFNINRTTTGSPITTSSAILNIHAKNMTYQTVGGAVTDIRALTTDATMNVEIENFTQISPSGAFSFGSFGLANVEINNATDFAYLALSNGISNVAIGNLTVTTTTGVFTSPDNLSYINANIRRATLGVAYLYSSTTSGSAVINVGTLTSTARLVIQSSSGSLYLNITNLTSTNTSTNPTFSSTGTGQFDLIGTNWTVSTVNQAIISATSNITMNLGTVIFTNASSGTGQLVFSSGNTSGSIASITSTSSTAQAIISQTTGNLRMNIPFITSLATAYRVSTGTMLIQNTKATNSNNLEVVRITGAATVELFGSYSTTGTNAIVVDNGSANISLMGCKLYSTGAAVFKSTAGLMNVFSSGSIGRVVPDILRITIVGSLLISSLLPQ